MLNRIVWGVSAARVPPCFVFSTNDMPWGMACASVTTATEREKPARVSARASVVRASRSLPLCVSR